MKGLLAVVSFVLFASSLATAGEVEDGFVSLFNGKDLSGWHIMDGPDDAFFVDNGMLMTRGTGHYPCWLRSDKTYENFVLRFDYLLNHYSETGLFVHAPLHGRHTRVGVKVQICDDTSRTSPTLPTGSIVEIARSREFEAKKDEQWNSMEVVMDYPLLRVTLNGKVIQEVDWSKDKTLRYRLRSGYLGLQHLGRYIVVKHMRIKVLPDKEQPWQPMFNANDFEGWEALGSAPWEIKDGVVKSSGGGYQLTKQLYEDFNLFTYVRSSTFANGGIFFRWKTHNPLTERGYEMQIYNVPETTNPTGSLYAHHRAEVLTSRDNEWFPMQLFVEGKRCVIRVNGETVVDADDLEVVRPGRIALQMHQQGATVEWKGLRIQPKR